MVSDDNFRNASAPQNKAASRDIETRTPNWPWILRWVLLTTAAIPAAMLLSAPLAVVLMPIFNLVSDLGIITGYDPDILGLAGFLISFSILLAAAQWRLMCDFLPNARGWFWATMTGLLVGGLVAGIGFSILSDIETAPGVAVISFLLVGFTTGITQWLFFRPTLLNAYWIVVIDTAAACSSLLVGRSITSIPELLAILFLPGIITGLGFWLLLSSSQPPAEAVHQEHPAAAGRRTRLTTRIAVGVVALVPAFFLFIWIYAASQLALAKNEGIYSSVEEAVIIKNSQGWGDAEVIKLEDVRASVNQHDGSQPHVWFGGARVYLDRVPQGSDRTEYLSGSYYLHVKEGWVHVPEGAFPGFIGWVMELYNMEGVDEWAAESG